MTRFMTWLVGLPAMLETWLTRAIPRAYNFGRVMGRVVARLGNMVFRMMMVGVVLSILVAINPEIAEKMPIIYQFYTGSLKAGDFLFSQGIQCIYSICMGTFSEFWTKYTAELKEILGQFADWISGI